MCERDKGRKKYINKDGESNRKRETEKRERERKKVIQKRESEKLRGGER